MALNKINNINLRLPIYSGKFWLLLLMSVSVKLTAQIYVSDKTVFTVKENTIIHSSENISGHVSQSNSNEAQKVKIYIKEGTQIDDFFSDSLHEILYLEKEKKSEKPIKEIARKEKKERDNHNSTAKNTEDLREKELFTVFKSKQSRSSVIFSSGNRLNAISAHSNSFTFKSLSAKQKQGKKYYVILFDLEHKQSINFFRDNLRKPQHFLEEHITRPPPFRIGNLV